MKRTLIFLKEYFTYIKMEPRLISAIPKRIWEEFSLYARFIFVKSIKTSKNVRLLKQLEGLRADMEKADPVYKPSIHWEDLYNQFERVLYVEDIKNFKTQRYNRTFSAFAPTNPRFYKMFLWAYWQLIRKRDSLHLLHTLEEPRIGNPVTYDINGTVMSYDLLQSLDEFYTIYPRIKTKHKHIIVAELGAGYGRLGYVSSKAIPKSTYIIVDLPGSLILSQYYLSRLFPRHKVLTYDASRRMKKFDRALLSKYKIVFLAPWQLTNIADESLDVFINIYSFQEMTMPQIENYFSLIDKKCKGIFYTKQYYDNENLKDQLRITKNDYPIRKHWKTIFERTSTVSQHVFESLYKV